MPSTAVTRILVPIDFSPCSRAALEYAAQFADQVKARVDVLHVHEQGFIGSEPLAMVPLGAARGRGWEETRKDVIRELDAFLGSMRNRVRDVRVESGLPGDVIPDIAKRGGFDLIVMGTHGRGGLSRLIVGSVAEAVMRKAAVPVLTLRMPKREARERVPL